MKFKRDVDKPRGKAVLEAAIAQGCTLKEADGEKLLVRKEPYEFMDWPYSDQEIITTKILEYVERCLGIKIIESADVVEFKAKKP